MTLVRWDPLRDMVSFNQQLANRLIGSDDSYGAWAPPVDIFEQDQDLIIRAEVPGVEKDAIEVHVEDNTLVLRGERKREEEIKDDASYRLERTYGSFVRSFRLPKTVDGSRIKAAYKNGVLEIKLPKAEEAKPRRIEILSA